MKQLAWTGAVVVLGLAGPALADPKVCLNGEGNTVPCTYQIDDTALQRVPALFKFQARVSKAKIPVGDATFATVYVNLKKGAATLCSETFTNVTVRDSVLNLEIGGGMSCSLDEKIAANNDLSFQVCLNNQQNCLKSVKLGSVPYAIASSYAMQAQEANKADIAGQAHYAHRLTAERDLFTSESVSKGYFDFYTHPAAQAGNLYTPANYVPYDAGGFIQWAPVSAADDNTLHICGKDVGTDKPVYLEQLVLAATTTYARGALVTQGVLFTDGAVEVNAGMTIANGPPAYDLIITGDAQITSAGSLTVDGDLIIGGDIQPSGEFRGLKLGEANSTGSNGGGNTDPDRLLQIHIADNEGGGMIFSESSVTKAQVTYNPQTDDLVMNNGGSGLTVRSSGWVEIKDTNDSLLKFNADTDGAYANDSYDLYHSSNSNDFLLAHDGPGAAYTFYLALRDDPDKVEVLQDLDVNTNLNVDGNTVIASDLNVTGRVRLGIGANKPVEVMNELHTYGTIWGYDGLMIEDGVGDAVLYASDLGVTINKTTQFNKPATLLSNDSSVYFDAGCVLKSADIVIPAASGKEITLQCDPGYVATGGGTKWYEAGTENNAEPDSDQETFPNDDTCTGSYRIGSIEASQQFVEAWPSATDTWKAVFKNERADTECGRLYVTCCRLGP